MKLELQGQEIIKFKLFIWKDEHDTKFKKVKILIVWEVVLMYPDFNTTLEIYMDASKYKLGVVVVHHSHPITIFQWKTV